MRMMGAGTSPKLHVSAVVVPRVRVEAVAVRETVTVSPVVSRSASTSSTARGGVEEVASRGLGGAPVRARTPRAPVRKPRRCADAS